MLAILTLGIRLLLQATLTNVSQNWMMIMVIGNNWYSNEWYNLSWSLQTSFICQYFRQMSGSGGQDDPLTLTDVLGESRKFIEDQRFNCANLGQTEGKDASRSQRSVKSCDNLWHMDDNSYLGNSPSSLLMV